jgi:hypothetical protein
MTATPADRLMLDLLRESSSLPGPFDPLWEGCAASLAREALAGVGLSLLKKRGMLEDLHPAARRRLETELNKVRAEQVILFHRFGALADRLAKAGIPSILHKGGALAPLIYDRADDRPMVDIDVLIRPEDWARTHEMLLAATYRFPAGEGTDFWRENYYNVAVSSPEDPPASFDLHWSITQEGRYRISTDDLFARAVPFEWEGRRLLRMGNEDLLMSLFLHLAYHYFEARLLWLYDMKRLMTAWSIDWDVLRERADAWGLRTVAALNLGFLRKVFPEAVPPEAARVSRSGALRSALLAPLRSPETLHLFRAERRRTVHFVVGLLAIDRPADAMRFAGDKIARSWRWMGRAPRTR